MGGRFWVGALACALCVASSPEAKASGRLWTEGRRVSLRAERSRVARVARAAVPAVVAISARHAGAESAPDVDEEPQRELGAGFIIRSDGLILTSSHVIESSVEVTVSLYSPNGAPEELPARVVGKDEQTDLALLKVDARRPLPVLKLGSVDNVDLADWVVVIGNPFGLSNTVSVGVVSYKGRADVVPEGRSGYFDYLQTDAAINPGSSGGPVLDERGEVVAIANAVNVSGQGIGFAVPIDMAKAVVPQLFAYGEVRRGWLGLSVVDLAPEWARKGARGVVVSQVVPRSPAARAGLSEGDIIVGLDQGSVDKADRLRWNLTTAGEGHTVALTVRHGGQLKTVRVRLEAPPAKLLQPVPLMAQARVSPTVTHVSTELEEEDLLSSPASSERAKAP